MGRIINLGILEDFMGNWAQGNVLTNSPVCRKSFESKQKYQRPYLRVVGGRLLSYPIQNKSLARRSRSQREVARAGPVGHYRRDGFNFPARCWPPAREPLLLQ
jgi:hypothetical protein